MANKLERLAELAANMEGLGECDPEPEHLEADEILVAALLLLAGKSRYQVDAKRIADHFLKMEKWYA